MPNVASVLKEEISRLARKEIRSATETTRKDVVRLKRTVTEHKRRIAALEKENRRLAGITNPMREEMVKPEEEEVKKARITGTMVENLRSKFSMTQAEFGLLVGVTPVTVLKWEHTDGRLSPRGGSKAALVELRKLSKREAQERLEEAVAAQKKASKKKRRRKKSQKRR